MGGFRRGVAACALSAIVLWAAPAGAQSLDRARQLYMEADFRGAADAFEEVLAAEELQLEVAAAAHGALAALRLMLGDEATARSHAEAAVALDPEVAAPDGAPESAGALLREVAATTEAAVLAIEAEEPLTGGEEASVSARLTPAPRLLVAELRLACESDGGVADERGPPPVVRLAVRVDGTAVRCQAAAVSTGGAPLLSVARDFELRSDPPEEVVAAVEGPVDDEPRDEPTDDPEPQPPWQGWLWVGIGAGALVLVAVVTVVLVLTLAPGGDVVLIETEIEGW